MIKITKRDLGILFLIALFTISTSLVIFTLTGSSTTDSAETDVPDFESLTSEEKKEAYLEYYWGDLNQSVDTFVNGSQLSNDIRITNTYIADQHDLELLTNTLIYFDKSLLLTEDNDPYKIKDIRVNYSDIQFAIDIQTGSDVVRGYRNGNYFYVRYEKE